MKAALRGFRANSLHYSGRFILDEMRRQKLAVVPLAMRRNFTRSLIELKRKKDQYDFGPAQLRALDSLIELSRKAKTFDDIREVHQGTCFLGSRRV